MTLPIFPALAGIAYPVRRTPRWSTLKQEAVSGKTTALQLWSYPAYRYELAYDLLRADSAHLEWQTLVGFFNLVGGAAQPFLFNDPDDGSAAGQSLGSGDGATTQFNLVRALGGFIEPVQAASAASLQLFIDGAATTAFSTLAFPNGAVYGAQFSTPPAAGAAITASFAYSWLCRFDEDTAEFDKFASDFWELKKITFSTVKQ
jgi:uncharacterized protein (TIGR02217 family)